MYILVPAYLAFYMMRTNSGIPSNWLIVPDNAYEKVLYGMWELSQVKVLTSSQFYLEHISI